VIGPDAEVLRRDHLHIGGQWVEAASGATMSVFNPATEAELGHVPAGGAVDIDRAVAAARAATGSWAGTPASERARYLQALAEALGHRAMEIGTLVSHEIGMPVRMATLIQAGLPTMVMGTYPALATELHDLEVIGGSTIERAPIGVVGAITPWNYPLHQAVAKVAPALAAGCTVVLKPSELAPLTAFLLADLAEEVGLPPGVLNVVSGAGEAGAALVDHDGVDMISFTGSTAVGRRVAASAGARLRRVSLELGGKSAALLLDDCDLADAVAATVNQCFLNAGQTCIAWSRMVVPKARYDEAVELARVAAEGFVVGDPLDWSTTMGPLVSAAQRQRVKGFIAQAITDGARLVAGGLESPPGITSGYFVAPTVFADVDEKMSVAREEIFGPVICVLAHDGDDDAVRIANDSPYGLHGAVFSADRQRAMGVARRMQTGMVDVCGGGFNPLAPWGGWKQSGLGRELGRFGLEEYLQTTSIQLP